MAFAMLVGVVGVFGAGVVLAVLAIFAHFAWLSRKHSAKIRHSAPLPHDLISRGVLDLASMLREGRVTSRELVLAYRDQILALNPSLNAMVCDRFEAALAEADVCDAALARARQQRSGRASRRRTGVRSDAVADGCDIKEFPPLFGVPITVKECIAVRGMPQSSGLLSRRELRSVEDAPVVQRLRAAGAIVLGVTNTSELCMWYESENRVYGRTNNPYNLHRIVGGSSGGEAAAVSACFGAAGVGSDVGGSIRMPAFFCGVFGHKPTGGLVPNTGQYPIAENDALLYLTTGPIARHARDLFPMLQLMAGPDGRDSRCVPMALGRPEDVDVRRLTVLVVAGCHAPLVTPLSRAQQDALRRAADCLQRLGCRVLHATFPLLDRSFEIWSAMMGAQAQTPFSVLLNAGRPLPLLRSWLRFVLRRSPHTFPALLLASTEVLPKLMPARAAAAVRDGAVLKRQVEDALHSAGASLTVQTRSGALAPPPPPPELRLPAAAAPAVAQAVTAPGPDTSHDAGSAGPNSRRRSRSRSRSRVDERAGSSAAPVGPHASAEAQRTVILFPTFPRTAPPHNAPLLRPMDFVYTGVWNVLQVPATQVPMGLDATGLPTGVQVIGARGCDHVTLAVAAALERGGVAGWVSPLHTP